MGKLLRWLVVVAALAVMSAGCEQRTANVFPEMAANEWEAARNAGDADAMAAVHTEDAQILPPNAPVVEGRAAIRAYFRNLFEQRTAPAVFDAREIIVFGNFAYRQGIYAVTLADGHTEYGKFIQLWKRHDGVWKIHRQMWSRNGPALGPAEETAPQL